MGDRALRDAKKLAGLNCAIAEQDEENAVQAMNTTRFLGITEFLADRLNGVFHDKNVIMYTTLY